MPAERVVCPDILIACLESLRTAEECWLILRASLSASYLTS